MAVSRYSRSLVVGKVNYLASSTSTNDIRNAIAAGNLKYKTLYTTGAERLDTIAGREYGDGRYWWVIAAASNIGWGLQVPAGTQINVPSLNDVLTLVA